MAITETDIKLLKSARMTDTPDGGGRMTGNVVQSGVDNNIFDDVSNLARVYGEVSLRKVFAGVMTNTTDKYLGARVIIDEPPADAYIDGVLFGASSLFDTREAARVKIEAYLAMGASYQGLLYGTHLAGMMTVMLFQEVDRKLPTIGQVLVLRSNMGLPSEETQYVRVSQVSSQVLSFTDDDGVFTRRVVTCAISDPLRVTFPGFEARRFSAQLDYTGMTRVYETMVANASQYFGIRPLSAPATLGSFALKADTIFSSLLPAAQSETPIADSRTNGQRATILPVGLMMRETVSMAWSPTQHLFVGGAVTPNSFAIEGAGVTLVDRGGKLMNGSVEVGSIDHSNGIAKLSTNVWGSATTFNYSYMPGDATIVPEQTLSLPISINNRSLSYTRTLLPMPAAGSLSVSYMAEGAWYTLADDGTGVLKGPDTSVGVGSMNYGSGTCIVTLGALPDVGSAILFSWTDPQMTSFTPGSHLVLGGAAYFAINSDGEATEAKGTKALSPNSVAVTWTVGATTYTATDNGFGVLTGDGTGSVDYSQGVVRLVPNILPPSGTMINLQSSRNTRTTSAPVNINGGTVAAGITPRTVAFDLEVSVLHVILPGVGEAAEQIQNLKPTPVVKTVRVIDDGVGTLFFTDGPNGNLAVGTVNYTSGVLGMNPGGALAAGTVDCENVEITYLGTAGENTSSNYSNNTSWSRAAGASAQDSTYTPPQMYPLISSVGGTANRVGSTNT